MERPLRACYPSSKSEEDKIDWPSKILKRRYVSDHQSGSACWQVGLGGQVYTNLERLHVVQKEGPN